MQPSKKGKKYIADDRSPVGRCGGPSFDQPFCLRPGKDTLGYTHVSYATVMMPSFRSFGSGGVLSSFLPARFGMGHDTALILVARWRR
jgi:hypothetical protein